jgi:spermidine/putrescine transport system permease protein
VGRTGKMQQLKKHRRFGLYTLLFPTSAWLLFFILIPISMFGVYSFWVVRNETIVREFSFGNYVRFFTNPLYPNLLLRSLIIAFGVTIITFITSYPLALYIFRQSGRVKSLLYMFVLIPLLTSYIVRIYAMRLVLGSNGLINNFLIFIGLIEDPLQILLFNRFAIFLTLCVTLSPFMVMPIYTSLEKVPISLIEASRDLGASDLQTFWRVVFPISVPGVVAGSMFIFILSLGDFLTPILVGGTQGMTISKAIQMNFGIAYNWPLGAALSAILLLIALSTILVSNRFGALREI